MAFTFAMLLVLFGLRGYAAQEAAVNSFVPLNSPVTASIDVPGVWKATAKLRAHPMISQGIGMAEAGLDLSIERDLLSWLGQASVALTSVDNGGPKIALFFQIRDAEHMLPADRLERLVQQMLPGGSKAKWQDVTYRNIKIRRIEVGEYPRATKIAMATQDGWLTLAIGDGVIRQVLDTHAGATPSLATHPLFTKATAGLPEGALGQICVNGQAIVAQMRASSPEAADMMQNTEVNHFFVAGALSTTADNLQLDVNYCTSNPKTVATLKQLRTEAGVVSGASLAQIPKGAFATVLIAKPDAWVGAVEQIMLDSCPTDEYRDDMRKGMAEFDGVRGLLKHITGEVGVTGIWQEGDGFGITVAGQTGAAGDADATSTAMSELFKKMEVETKINNGVTTLPETASDMHLFKMLLCWTTSKEWLLGASHPAWLGKAVEKPTYVLPASAKNASLAACGDLSFLPSMLKAMDAPEMVTQGLAMLDLGDGKWSYTVVIDEDGSTVHQHTIGGAPMLAVTAAVIFPVFAKSREKARQSTSLANLRQLAVALLMYAQDNKQKFPVLKTPADIEKNLGLYVGGSTQMFISPRTGERYEVNPRISGKSIGAFENLTEMIVLYEKTPGPDGSRCVAFMDGHVRLVHAYEWDEVKKQSKMP